MTRECDRCEGGTWTRQDGSRFRCAYCGGTGVLKGRPVDQASNAVARKRHEQIDEQLEERLEDDAA